MWKKAMFIGCSAILGVSIAVGDVPPQRLHKPNVPFLLESMRFQTVQMRVFDPLVSGMIRDPYSDLQWNPAFVLDQTWKSFYLDFNPRMDAPAFLQSRYTVYANPYQYSRTYMVLPRWYSRTTVNTVDTSPIYNVAAVAALSPRISVGFINRSVFDYGPFRSAYQVYYGSYAELSFSPSADFPSDLEPQRLEVDDNQQTVAGTQTELSVGYRVLENLNLGIRLGHFTYDRDGTLYDSKWAFYPHSSFADLEDESLDMGGGHQEVGLGLTYRPNDGTRIGIYGGFTTGNGTETIASVDTSDSWWERDTDTTYYRTTEYSLESRETYASEGNRPTLTLTFERVISPTLSFRSFLYGSRSTLDVSGSMASSDTSYGDRTYDYWTYSGPRFRRHEYHGSREGNLEGSGEETEETWRWFVSLIYGENRDWSGFVGILLNYHTFDQRYDELSDYRTHRWDGYTLYDPEEFRYFYRHDKRYLVTLYHERWSLFLPVSVKAQIVSGLSVLLGTDLTLMLTDEESKGRLLYPERITRRWEDGDLIVEDLEIDRYEEFTSDPARTFNRTIQQRLGIAYEHPSGVRLYVRSRGDVFQSANWAMGFEMRF